MKYATFRVYGYPRSGNHYLTALIAKNFFETEDFTPFLGRHETVPNELKDQTCACFFVKRDFERVAKSLFELRHLYGVSENDYEQFIRRPMDSMYDHHVSPRVEVNLLTHKHPGSTRSHWFKNRRESLWKSHRDYCSIWFHHCATHVNSTSVYYESLVERFEAVMMSIAIFLGSERRVFQDIRERVGLYTVGSEWNGPRKPEI